MSKTVVKQHLSGLHAMWVHVCCSIHRAWNVCSARYTVTVWHVHRIEKAKQPMPNPSHYPKLTCLVSTKKWSPSPSTTYQIPREWGLQKGCVVLTIHFTVTSVKDSEQDHSMGSPMDRTSPRSEDVIEIVKSKTICAVTIWRPLKWQKERKKGGAARSQT